MIKKWMTAAALLAMVGTVSSATLYTTGVLDFNKTTKGSYLGKIGAAVPVTVLKKQGSLSYVRISGWTLAEYPSMIFAEPGVRIEYGSFDEESAVKTNPKAGEKVVQENRWVKATAEGWVQSAKLTNNLTSSGSKVKLVMPKLAPCAMPLPRPITSRPTSGLACCPPRAVVRATRVPAPMP